MERLTTNKITSEMGMYELAHNCCYVKNGSVRYRDYGTDTDIREFARGLMIAYGHWKSCEEYGLDADNELVDDDIFDEAMMENLMYSPYESIGLIALFYRNLWSMADLLEKLKAYEDLEEQGLLLRLPCKVGDTVYRICPKCNNDHDGTCKNCAWQGAAGTNGCNVYGLRIDGRHHPDECTIVPYKVTWNYIQNLLGNMGKTVFLTREEAETALKKTKESEENNHDR